MAWNNMDGKPEAFRKESGKAAVLKHRRDPSCEVSGYLRILIASQAMPCTMFRNGKHHPHGPTFNLSW
jgi:hypothetical protein